MIRGEQKLSDGNHRTALLALALSLASAEIVLLETFDIFRAYMLISARDHPGNKDNSLGPEAQVEVAGDLMRYLEGRYGGTKP